MTTPLVVIFLAGQPRGKGRPRFGRAGEFVRVWTDKKTSGYETLLAEIAIKAMKPRQPLLGAVSVAIEAGMAIPVSWSKKQRSAALAGDRQPVGKPDFDNIAKIVGDSLNKIVWKDDSQIVVCSFRKFFSDAPGLKIAVWEWDQ